MNGAILGLVISAAVGLPLCLVVLLIKSKGERVVRKFTSGYAHEFRIFSGCGIVWRYNRVPGVLGMLQDGFVYESIIGGRKGTIPFKTMQSWCIEDTRGSRHRRMRKYRKAKVLELVTDDAVHVFVLSRQKAALWEQYLSELREMVPVRQCEHQ